MNNKKLISFYSNKASQGLRTVSLAFANLLARQDYNVLYVELDTNDPSIAKALQIQTGSNNIVSYFEKTIDGEFDDVRNYVLSKEKIIANSERKQKTIYAGLENNVDYLVAPLEFKPSEMPDLIGNAKLKSENVEEFVIDYVERFVGAITDLEYDFIVCKLANDVDHMFTYEMMKRSDFILSVATPSVTKLIGQGEVKRFLFEQNKELEKKWRDILNMTSQEVQTSEYRNLLNTDYIIPFDPERQKEELALQPDSELIRQSLERLVLDLGIKIQITMNEEKVPLFQRLFKSRG